MKNLFQVETYVKKRASTLYNTYYVQAECVDQAIGKANKIKDEKKEKIRSVIFVHSIDA